MTNRTAAARYARALFDVSVKTRDLRRTEADLVRFSDMVAGHETLRKVLANPAIPAARKLAVVTELVARLQPCEPAVAKLLALLADRDRLTLLPDLIATFRARLLDHLGIVEALITTAQPMTPTQSSVIERSLAQASGRQITMINSVDPDILGGLVARLGTTVYDGSVANHLVRLRHALLEGR